MYFIHGTKINPENKSDFKFRTFNYKISATGEIDNDLVGNGNDEQGPGINAFGSLAIDGFKKDELDAANMYALNGALVVFSADFEIDSGDGLEVVKPMNEYEVDFIPKDEWCVIIENIVDKIRFYHNYDLESLFEVCDKIEAEEDPEIQKELFDNNLSSISDISEPSEFECVEDWVEDAKMKIEMEDPASFIYESGGPELFAERAHAQDNLWESIKFVFNHAAYVDNGVKMSYNDIFINSVLNNSLNADYLKYANADGGVFQIIFDTSSISIIGMKHKEMSLNNERFERMIDEFVEFGSVHSGVLEDQQLKTEYNNIAKSFFGREIDANLMGNVLLIKDEVSLTANLRNGLAKNFSVPEMKIFEVDGARMSKFLDGLESVKQKNEKTLEMNNEPVVNRLSVSR